MDCKLPNKCWCKECRRKYDAARFQSIKPERYAQVKARREELTKWVRELKSNPCTDCDKIFHPVAMEFDYLGDKRQGIADLVKSGHSKETILKEIEKCELVCANCHAVRTFNRRGLV